MTPLLRHTASIILGFTLAASIAATGCAVRYYDADHRDYHRWDPDEDRAYHAYWSEAHPREPYRDYPKLDAKGQSDYWNWRHGHPEAGKAGDRNDRDRH